MDEYYYIWLTELKVVRDVTCEFDIDTNGQDL